MSVAGGISNAVERAVLHGCEALQIFSKNARQLRGKPLDPADVRTFRRRIDETGITPVVSHASYLINLATASPTLREPTLAALIDELDRAEALGLLGVVIHPGVCTSGDRGRRAASDRRRHPLCLQGPSAQKDDGPARAHGGAGPDARTSLRAPRHDHRAREWLSARGCVSRYLSPRRVRLRHRVGRWLSRHLRGLRSSSSASIG